MSLENKVDAHFYSLVTNFMKDWAESYQGSYSNRIDYFERLDNIFLFAYRNKDDVFFRFVEKECFNLVLGLFLRNSTDDKLSGLEILLHIYEKFEENKKEICDLEIFLFSELRMRLYEMCLSLDPEKFSYNFSWMHFFRVISVVASRTKNNSEFGVVREFAYYPAYILQRNKSNKVYVTSELAKKWIVDCLCYNDDYALSTDTRACTEVMQEIQFRMIKGFIDYGFEVEFGEVLANQFLESKLTYYMSNNKKIVLLSWLCYLYYIGVKEDKIYVNSKLYGDIWSLLKSNNFIFFRDSLYRTLNIKDVSFSDAIEGIYSSLRYCEYEHTHGQSRLLIMRDVVREFCLLFWILMYCENGDLFRIDSIDLNQKTNVYVNLFYNKEGKLRETLEKFLYFFGMDEKDGFSIDRLKDIITSFLGRKVMDDKRVAQELFEQQNNTICVGLKNEMRLYLKHKFFNMFCNKSIIKPISSMKIKISLLRIRVGTDDFIYGLDNRYSEICYDNMLLEIFRVLDKCELFNMEICNSPIYSRDYVNRFHELGYNMIVGSDYSVENIIKSAASAEREVYNLQKLKYFKNNVYALDSKALQLTLEDLNVDIIDKDKDSNDKFYDETLQKLGVKLTKEEFIEYLKNREKIMVITADVIISWRKPVIGSHISIER